MTRTWVGMAVVVGSLLLLMLVLRAVQRRFNPPAEVVRKTLHVGMGLVVLTFPWWFDHWWPAAVLAVVCTALLLAVRLQRRLHAKFGAVLGSVQRASWGEVYYPIAIALLFYLSEGDKLLFCIPVLVLALSDTVAAVVGVRYGRRKYTVLDGHKSVEGSAGFFVVTFASVVLPLGLTGESDWAQAAMIAAVLGLVVMVMEAIAWRGLDNLFVPLGVFALLKIYIEFDSLEPLIARLVVLILLVAFAFVWRARSTLDDSALLGGALFAYACWALGDWPWVVPPLILFVLHASLWHRGKSGAGVHTVRAVLSTASPALVWLMVYVMTRDDVWLRPFVVVFAAHVTLNGVSWMRLADFSLRGLPKVVCWIVSGSVAVFGLMLGVAAVGGVWDDALWREAVIGVGGVAAAGLAFWLTLPRLLDAERKQYRAVHVVGGLCAWVASAVWVIGVGVWR